MKSAAELQNLANLAEERGDYAKAARLHVKALAKIEKEVGSEQPELIDYLFNLGMINCALDKKDEAKDCFTRQLSILLQFYPEVHVDVVELRQILADIDSSEEIAVTPLAVSA
ncbi:MAG: tetratricopeptide repeat protein [Candidatus Obscuribacterales bacterium]|jgi:tetratricopeptide (TPR) repeat protein|nr:tetratricopeptide repeat protein [Candidatus Obscuribacterales bacterium]